MRNHRFGKRRSLSAMLALSVVAALIIAILTGAYVVLVLPGSLPTQITSTFSVNTSTSIAPNNNPNTVLTFARVYISAGASNGPNNTSFDPQTITVAISINSTVVWINLDSRIQQVVGQNGMFNSGNMIQLQSWNYTFTTAGTYQYSNPTYPWETGTIVVVS